MTNFLMLHCSASKGDPTSILPILHYVLLSFSPLLATHFAAKGYELYGKKDSRFLESVYSLLLKEFTYRPVLNRHQFFTTGFAERKLLFAIDVIHFCKQLHRNLARSASVRKTSKAMVNLPISTEPNISPQSSPGKSVSFQTTKIQVLDESKSNAMSPLARFTTIANAPRYFSPEIVLASLYQTSPRGIAFDGNYGRPLA